MKPKMFPIQGGGRPIPWGLIEPHAEQVQKNHGWQTLELLAVNGGLIACEALCALDGEGLARLTEGPHGFTLTSNAPAAPTMHYVCTCDDHLQAHARRFMERKPAPEAARTIQEIAAELFVCAEGWVPGARLIGNVTAEEIAVVADYARRKAESELERETRAGLASTLDELDGHARDRRVIGIPDAENAPLRLANLLRALEKAAS